MISVMSVVLKVVVIVVDDFHSGGYLDGLYSAYCYECIMMVVVYVIIYPREVRSHSSSWRDMNGSHRSVPLNLCPSLSTATGASVRAPDVSEDVPWLAPPPAAGHHLLPHLPAPDLPRGPGYRCSGELLHCESASRSIFMPRIRLFMRSGSPVINALWCCLGHHTPPLSVLFLW